MAHFLWQCSVPFRPCVQGFAYRSATLKHVSTGIDRGRGLPVCTFMKTDNYSHTQWKHTRPPAKPKVLFELRYSAMIPLSLPIRTAYVVFIWCYINKIWQWWNKKKIMNDCKSEILTLWWGCSSWTHLHVDLDWVNRQFIVVCNCEAPVALQVQEGVWGLWAFRSGIETAVRAIPYFPITTDKCLLICRSN